MSVPKKKSGWCSSAYVCVRLNCSVQLWVLRILMAWGKKLLHSLADMARMLWNPLPDVRDTKRWWEGCSSHTNRGKLWPICWSLSQKGCSLLVCFFFYKLCFKLKKNQFCIIKPLEWGHIKRNNNLLPCKLMYHKLMFLHNVSPGDF